MSDINITEDAKLTFIQKLKAEAKKKLRELAAKATNPETYIDAASKQLKGMASDAVSKIKKGKSLKPGRKK